jgi:hypothetical protein
MQICEGVSQVNPSVQLSLAPQAGRSQKFVFPQE